MLFFYLSFFATSVFAALPNMFGMGQASMSSGMTAFTEKPTPYHAFSQPSVLGFLNRVEASTTIVSTSVSLNEFPDGLLVDTQGFATSGVLGGNGQQLGLAFPIGTKETYATVAVSAYLPWDSLSRVTGNPTNYPYYIMYQDITRNTYYSAAVGMRVWRGLSLGIGVSSSIKTVAKYQFGQANSGNISASAAEVRSKSAPIVSATYHFGLPFTLGLQYRDRTFMETQINAQVDSTIAGTISGALTSFPFYSPAEIMLSVASRPTPQWFFSGDLMYVLWEEYPLPFSSGNVQDFTVGNTGAKANFDNKLVGRVGAQKTWVTASWFRTLRARMGYQFHPSPVPDQTGDTNFADSTRHTLTFGGGFEREAFRSRIAALNVFFQWHRLVERDVTKSASSNIGAPGYTIGGDIFVYGLGASLKF